MDKDRETEILLVANATADRIDKRIEGRFTRVHERIDSLVDDVANIKGKVSLFPSPADLDKKIDNRVKVCRENHDEKDRIKSEISKKDWMKIIIAIVVLVAAAFGVDLSLN